MFNLQKLNAIAKPDTQWLPEAEYRKKHRKQLKREIERRLNELKLLQDAHIIN